MSSAASNTPLKQGVNESRRAALITLLKQGVNESRRAAKITPPKQGVNESSAALDTSLKQGVNEIFAASGSFFIFSFAFIRGSKSISHLKAHAPAVPFQHILQMTGG